MSFSAPAMAAEVDSLTLNERSLMVATVVNALSAMQPAPKPRPLVICGVYATDTPTRLQYIALWAMLNCSGVLFNIPYTGDDAQFVADATAAARALPKDMFMQLQDWNATGTGLPMEVILSLWADLPQFISIKVGNNPNHPKQPQQPAS